MAQGMEHRITHRAGVDQRDLGGARAAFFKGPLFFPLRPAAASPFRRERGAPFFLWAPLPIGRLRACSCAAATAAIARPRCCERRLGAPSRCPSRRLPPKPRRRRGGVVPWRRGAAKRARRLLQAQFSLSRPPLSQTTTNPSHPSQQQHQHQQQQLDPKAALAVDAVTGSDDLASPSSPGAKRFRYPVDSEHKSKVLHPWSCLGPQHMAFTLSYWAFMAAFIST